MLQLTLLMGSDVSRGGLTADLYSDRQYVLSTAFLSEVNSLKELNSYSLFLCERHC